MRRKDDLKMEKEIKKSLMFYGGNYEWVKNNLPNLTDEAKIMIENGEAINTEHAAYLVIDKRF
jgi:hypothetical protein